MIRPPRSHRTSHRLLGFVAALVLMVAPVGTGLLSSEVAHAASGGDLVIDDVVLATEGATNVCLLDMSFTDATPFEIDSDTPDALGSDGLPVWFNDTTDFDGYTVAVPQARVPESVAERRRVFPEEVNHVFRWTSSLVWDGQRSAEEICSADFAGQTFMVYLGEYADNEYTGVEAAFAFTFPGTAPEPPQAALVKWGRANGKANVGTTVSVGRPQVVRGSTVAYVWKVGRKTVATQRTLRVRKAWKGKELEAVVGVAKNGYTSAVRAYRFGKVR